MQSWRPSWHQTLLLGFLGSVVCLGWEAAVSTVALASESRPQLPVGTIAVEGRIVCLDEALQSRLSTSPERECDPLSTRFALQTPDGDLYFFSPDDPKAEMFTDPRVRARNLLVYGWPRADRHLEIHDVYSVVAGRLHHIHYRCDVCDITATAPGPCWCCQKEFDFREEPYEGGGS